MLTLVPELGYYFLRAKSLGFIQVPDLTTDLSTQLPVLTTTARVISEQCSRLVCNIVD